MSSADTKSVTPTKTQYPVGLDVNHSYDVQRGTVSKWQNKKDGTVYFCIARAPESHAVFGSVTTSQWYDAKGKPIQHPGDYHWGKQTYLLEKENLVGADYKEFPNYVENQVWLQDLVYLDECVAPSKPVMPDAVLLGREQAASCAKQQKRNDPAFRSPDARPFVSAQTRHVHDPIHLHGRKGRREAAVCVRRVSVLWWSSSPIDREGP
jgi:hypothetical protein